MIYSLAYLLIVSTGVIFFFLRRVRLTAYWIAFYSSAIYSMPLLFQIDLFGRPIGDGASQISIFIMLVLLLVACAARSEDVAISQNSWSRAFSSVAVISAVAAFSLVILINGVQIFFVHKSSSGIADALYILWRVSASIAFVACLACGRIKLSYVPALILLSTFFAGDRTAIALSAIAGLWLFLGRRNVSPVHAFSAVIFALSLGVVILFGKVFQAQWISGSLSSPSAFLLQVWGDGVGAVQNTEPFGTIAVMDGLVELEASPEDSLVAASLAQLLIVPSAFGFDSGAFNDFFQSRLFPGFKDRSMAYSYWGEGHVRYGPFGVIAFLAVYLVGLSIFQSLIRSTRFSVQVFGLIGGAYWAFYIHRNSMVSILAYERQLVLYLLVLVLITGFVVAFRRARRI